LSRGTAGGGVGAKIVATIPVNPGDTFTLGVGGQGQANDGNQAPGGGWASAGEYTGGSGGRARGSGTTDGSGGGGATTLTLNSQLIAVAAGGGGGGGGGGKCVGQGGTKSVDGGGGGGGGSSRHTFTAKSVESAALGNGSVVVIWQEPAATIAGTAPSQYLGRTYTYSFAVGGSATVTLTAGTLPPGLSLTDDGVITGVPTQVGTYPFTLTATNTISHAGLAAAITILATVAPTVQGTPPAGQVNAPYRYQFQVTGTPYATTTVSDPADLPPGLTLDGQTTTLAGTPAGAGTYRFTLIATNGVNPDARLSVTVVITSGLGQGSTHSNRAHAIGWLHHASHHHDGHRWGLGFFLARPAGC
jgi:Putative Ig domain